MSTREPEPGPVARVRLVPPPPPEPDAAREQPRAAAIARRALRVVDPAAHRDLEALETAGAGALRFHLLDRALEYQIIPRSLLRAASLHGAWARERCERRGGVVAQEERLRALLRRMSSGPIAEPPAWVDQRTRDLPPELLRPVLGPRLKHSACLWEPATTTLGQAEDAMLALTCLRAQIGDGMNILDLGCGMGSLSLWMAEHYPAARITGVSRSRRQQAWIEAERDRRNLSNLEMIASDVNDFAPRGRFDRVMSIETFERMRNWRELLRRMSTWLGDDGKAFVQVFGHRTLPYRFAGTWAAERFFTTGVMPSHDLLPRFQEHFELADRWVEPGTHYAKTLGAWLARLDAHYDEALEALLADGRSRGNARAVLGGWRLLLLSAKEMSSYGAGNHWLISHYLLEPSSGRG